MNIEMDMKKRRNQIQKELADCRTELQWLPKGRLECHRVKPNGRQKTETYRWFTVQNKKRKYLRKSDYELAEKLAYKRELNAKICELNNELMGTEAYLGITTGSGSKYASAVTNKKAYSNLNKKCYRENQEISRLAYNYKMKNKSQYYDWANEDYRDWDYYPEELTVRSKRGVLVRSRIEAHICDALDEHGLFYRYEDIMEFDGIVHHPDFVIWDTRNDNMIIWEHMGGLEQEKYRKTNINKLRRYFNNGYYPNLNLIITSEKEGEQLDLTIIEAIIEQFFE